MVEYQHTTCLVLPEQQKWSCYTCISIVALWGWYQYQYFTGAIQDCQCGPIHINTLNLIKVSIMLCKCLKFNKKHYQVWIFWIHGAIQDNSLPLQGYLLSHLVKRKHLNLPEAPNRPPCLCFFQPCQDLRFLKKYHKCFSCKYCSLIEVRREVWKTNQKNNTGGLEVNAISFSTPEISK